MKPIIPEAALNQHIAVLGKTRSGKSSVMRGLVEGLLERQQPVCIVDPKGDWWGIKLSKDGKRPGYPVVIFGGEHADVPINAHAGAHVAELFATGNRPCLIDLGGWMVGERTRFWIDFASTLFKHTKGMRWLVVDEVHNFAPKGKIMDPDAGKALHWSNRLASEGLGKGLAMLFASQRPQKVHNDTLTSAETLIAMRVLHPSDRGAVSDWIKGCGDLELGAKVLNSLAQMDRGEGWAWSPEIGFGPERVKFPMFKTYDSFRPQTPEDAQNLKGWAEVDLDEVKAKLATVVKEAEANDPKLLRAEIARLKAELGKKPETAPDQLSIAAARQEGREEGALAGYAAGMRAVKPIAERLSTLSSAVSDQVEAFQDDLRRLAAAHPPVQRPQAAAPAEVRGTFQPPQRAWPSARAQVQRKPAGGAGVALPKGEGLILAACIQFPNGLRREQLTVLTTFKRSTRDRYVLYLKEKGYVDQAGEVIVATEAGRAAMPDAEPLPTGEELRAYWLQRLPEGERKILEQLIEYYPKPVHRDFLTTATGLQRSTRDRYLLYMRNKQLIEEPSRGEVRASADLF